MTQAVVQAQYYYGTSSSPTNVNAETGIKFNREDTQSGTTAVPIPTSAGTNFSWIKDCTLQVTSSGTTNMSNRNVYFSSAPPAGIQIWWFSSSGYLQSTTANMPTSTAGAGDNATPSTAGGSSWTNMSSSPALYDNTSVATAAGQNGNFCKLIIGVASTGTYTGGPGSAIVLPNVSLQYDES